MNDMAIWNQLNNMAIWKKSLLYGMVCFVFFCLVSYATDGHFDRYTIIQDLILAILLGLTFPFTIRIISDLTKKAIHNMGLDKKSDTAE